MHTFITDLTYTCTGMVCKYHIMQKPQQYKHFYLCEYHILVVCFFDILTQSLSNMQNVWVFVFLSKAYFIH